MIGIDTNVLVRLLLEDDPDQARRCRQLVADEVAAGTEILVNNIALCELMWTLRKGYRFSRQQLESALETLLGAPSLHFEERAAVEEAAQLFSRTRADFADALIAVQNRRAGCNRTFTFDREAAKLPGMSLVPGA